MARNLPRDRPETFQNPVYRRSFPDPFVLKHRGEYFAYCTGLRPDGRVFGVLRSRDLVNWTEIGGAMTRLATDAPFYWAPEVVYANGRFYLYYSVGNETLMQLRVAVSTRPDGGFVDAGRRLTHEDFAIDGHVFIDADGAKYFFYATDFLDHAYIGTGTVVDRMLDFFTLEGRPRPVTRARYDWQVYDPQRREKGGVRWHTVEGPFVLKRKGLYYQMFSAGNWQNVTYGVGFAVTDDPARPDEWPQFCDGEKVLPILRTVPGRIVGPGHNSVVRGPNNRESYCVYHRWADDARMLAIDRLDFAGRRLFVRGATDTPQPAPYRPTFADHFDGPAFDRRWTLAGAWTRAGGEAVGGGDANDGAAALSCATGADGFLAEFSLRAAGAATGRTAALGVYLTDAAGTEVFRCALHPAAGRVAVGGPADGPREFALPADFVPEAVHLLRVESDGRYIGVTLDEANFRFEGRLPSVPERLALFADEMRAGFSGFALTAGFEDSFARGAADDATGRRQVGEGEIAMERQEFILTSRRAGDSVLTKGAAVGDFEFAVNLRLVEKFDAAAAYGFLILDEAGGEIYRFTFEAGEAGGALATDGDLLKFPLPAVFAPEDYCQFRFLRTGEKVFLQMEQFDLGAVSLAGGRVRLALFCRRAAIAFEMIRLTIL